MGTAVAARASRTASSTNGFDPRLRFGLQGGSNRASRREVSLLPELANQAACQISAGRKCLEMKHFFSEPELVVAGASAGRTNSMHDCIVFNLDGIISCMGARERGGLALPMRLRVLNLSPI